MGILDLKGLVALVTGGASGFGLATAQRLAKHGAKIVLCDLPTSRGQEVSKQIGENCVFAPTDVTSESDVKNALNIAESKFKKLNIVVNCAGQSLISRTYDFAFQKPHALEDFSNMLKVNTVGTFNVVRLSCGLLCKNEIDENRQKGVIVNTSSISGYEGSMGNVAFAACSRSVAAMTLVLSRELCDEGIRCCSIAPGLFDTTFFRSLPEKYRRYMPSVVPFPKGLGHPGEFAHLVQGIIENPYLNGEVLRLDAALRYDL